MGEAEQLAAQKAVAHANTPTVVHFDALGRTFLTVGQNRFPKQQDDGSSVIVEESYPTRVELDIEGNQQAARDAVVQNGDALGRIIMLYDYDMLGNRIHQASMEAGERWMLNDVMGKPIRAWDSRDHQFRSSKIHYEGLLIISSAKATARRSLSRGLCMVRVNSIRKQRISAVSSCDCSIRLAS